MFEKAISALSLINFIPLSYLMFANSCSTCKNMLFNVPFRNSQITLAGVLATISIIMIVNITSKDMCWKAVLLSITFVFSYLSSYLNLTRYLNGDYCYPCLTTTLIFYLIFCIAAYQVIIKNLTGTYFKSHK